MVSKTWYDGVFCDQAEPVGQEDVQDCITSCLLFGGLVKSKVVDFVEKEVANLLRVTISHNMSVFPVDVRKIYVPIYPDNAISFHRVQGLQDLFHLVFTCR